MSHEPPAWDAPLSFEKDLEPQPTYTDDVIAVMRATIDALRAEVADLRRANDELQGAAKRLQAALDGSPLPEGM